MKGQDLLVLTSKQMNFTKHSHNTHAVPRLSETIPINPTRQSITNKPRGGGRRILTSESAAQIIRIRHNARATLPSSSLSSAAVARQFGISPKAVRDIWNGRTWRHATETAISPLMPLEEFVPDPSVSSPTFLQVHHQSRPSWRTS